MFHRSAVFSCRICFLVHLTIRSSESDRQSESYRAIEREPEKDPKPLDSISYGSRMSTADPAMGALQNRVADNWRPLFTLADLAGGPWPRRVREIALAVDTARAEQSTGVQLIADCKAAFNEGTTDRLSSEDLV